nr:protein SIEVE ELEMENT OCCLUSION B-like [Ipomoea batatas]
MQVGLRPLKNKKVVLFISSDLDIDASMFMSIGFFIPTARLWIPIVDLRWDTETMNNHYRVLAKTTQIHGVISLEKFIAPGFARFVKKKFFPIFQIGGGPIAVLLDHYGRIVHCITTRMIVKKATDFALKGGPAIRNMDSIIPLFKNALKEATSSVEHLINIDEKIRDFANQMDSKLSEWFLGIQNEIQNSLESIVFKAVMEEDHWKGKTWCTKLLIGADNIPQAEEWVNANEHIFFIGGNDINWVKTFASKVLTEIYFIPHQTINMVYVGSNIKVASLIRQDMICETFRRISDGLAFWINLQGIFLSRIKFLNDACLDEKSDEIVKGLKLLLAYEAEEIGVVGRWALLCKGNKIVVHDLGNKMLTVMNEYPKWKESAIVKGFDQAFKDHHNEMFAGSTCTSQHHPCALECPSNLDKVPENIKCPQCCHNMQRFVTFRCYHDNLYKEFSDADED